MICLLAKCLSYADAVWLAVGFLGQATFFTRWLVQWFVSERTAESRVPVAFWYLSLIGGLVTLAYAIHIQDPVFIAGQSVGAFVYIRNLMLIRRSARAEGQAELSSSNGAGVVGSRHLDRPSRPDRPASHRNA